MKQVQVDGRQYAVKAWSGGRCGGGGGELAGGRAVVGVASMGMITRRHVGSFHTSPERHRYVIRATRSYLATHREVDNATRYLASTLLLRSPYRRGRNEDK